MTCFMCLKKIYELNKIQRHVANHRVCSDCYVTVVKFINSKREQAKFKRDNKWTI